MLTLIRRWAVLAHGVKNDVEAAYRRPDVFERRLMEDSSSHLAGKTRQPASGRLR